MNSNFRLDQGTLDDASRAIQEQPTTARARTSLGNSSRRASTGIGSNSISDSKSSGKRISSTFKADDLSVALLVEAQKTAEAVDGCSEHTDSSQQPQQQQQMLQHKLLEIISNDKVPSPSLKRVRKSNAAAEEAPTASTLSSTAASEESNGNVGEGNPFCPASGHVPEESLRQASQSTFGANTLSDSNIRYQQPFSAQLERIRSKPDFAFQMQSIIPAVEVLEIIFGNSMKNENSKNWDVLEQSDDKSLGGKKLTFERCTRELATLVFTIIILKYMMSTTQGSPSSDSGGNNATADIDDIELRDKCLQFILPLVGQRSGATSDFMSNVSTRMCYSIFSLAPSFAGRQSSPARSVLQRVEAKQKYARLKSKHQTEMRRKLVLHDEELLAPLMRSTFDTPMPQVQGNVLSNIANDVASSICSLVIELGRDTNRSGGKSTNDILTYVSQQTNQFGNIENSIQTIASLVVVKLDGLRDFMTSTSTEELGKPSHHMKTRSKK